MLSSGGLSNFSIWPGASVSLNFIRRILRRAQDLFLRQQHDRRPLHTPALLHGIAEGLDQLLDHPGITRQVAFMDRVQAPAQLVVQARFRHAGFRSLRTLAHWVHRQMAKKFRRNAILGLCPVGHMGHNGHMDPASKTARPAKVAKLSASEPLKLRPGEELGTKIASLMERLRAHNPAVELSATLRDGLLTFWPQIESYLLSRHAHSGDREELAKVVLMSARAMEHGLTRAEIEQAIDVLLEARLACARASMPEASPAEWDRPAAGMNLNSAAR